MVCSISLWATVNIFFVLPKLLKINIRHSLNFLVWEFFPSLFAAANFFLITCLQEKILILKGRRNSLPDYDITLLSDLQNISYEILMFIFIGHHPKSYSICSGDSSFCEGVFCMYLKFLDSHTENCTSYVDGIFCQIFDNTIFWKFVQFYFSFCTFNQQSINSMTLGTAFLYFAIVRGNVNKQTKM